MQTFRGPARAPKGTEHVFDVSGASDVGGPTRLGAGSATRGEHPHAVEQRRRVLVAYHDDAVLRQSARKELVAFPQFGIAVRNAAGSAGSPPSRTSR
jgi:hypothetical protein